jgi:hypothetical protein
MNPHAIVEIQGLPFHVDSWKEQRLFSRLNVELTSGECSQATWEVFDPDCKFIDKVSKADGIEMALTRVWLGFGPNLGEPVFKGLLTRVQRGIAKTTFIAYDMGFLMRLRKKSEYHKGDDLAIIKKLVERTEIPGGEKLKFQGPANPLKLEAHKAMAQDEQTDWEQVSERAHDAGLLLWVRGDTVFADYPATVGDPKITLVNKKDFQLLRDFDLQFKVPENKGGRPKGVEVRGRGRGGKRLKGTSDESKRGHQELHLKEDLAIHTKQRATLRAQAQKELDREHAFTLSIQTLPLTMQTRRVDVRETVRLQEVGRLFSGDYVAGRVSYDLTPGRLTGSFDLYRDVKE